MYIAEFYCKVFGFYDGVKMISSIQSAMSALQAFGKKIESNANNIANSNTEGFKQTRVILSDVEPNGVKATVEKTTNPGTMVYDQTPSGFEPIEQSNVDLGREFPEMMLNTHFYEANLKTLQAADELLSNVLDIKG